MEIWFVKKSFSFLISDFSLQNLVIFDIILLCRFISIYLFYLSRIIMNFCGICSSFLGTKLIFFLAFQLKIRFYYSPRRCMKYVFLLGFLRYSRGKQHKWYEICFWKSKYWSYYSPLQYKRRVWLIWFHQKLFSLSNMSVTIAWINEQSYSNTVSSLLSIRSDI